MTGPVKVSFTIEPALHKPKVEDVKELLQQGLKVLQLDVSSERQEKLLTYVDLMMKWNRAYNLTSVREAKDIMIRHILDSLSVGPHLVGNQIIDVGTGAGLPGIPLALVYPEKIFTLIDSNGKKARFLFHVQHVLQIENIQIINERVEGFQKSNLLKEVSQFKRYTTIISRAFSSLRDMLYNTEHLCAPEGMFLIMKGVYPLTELHELPPEFHLMAVNKIDVPFLGAERHLVKIGFE